jgi:hypothetical protein
LPEAVKRKIDLLAEFFVVNVGGCAPPYCRETSLINASAASSLPDQFFKWSTEAALGFASQVRTAFGVPSSDNSVERITGAG